MVLLLGCGAVRKPPAMMDVTLYIRDLDVLIGKGYLAFADYRCCQYWMVYVAGYNRVRRRRGEKEEKSNRSHKVEIYYLYCSWMRNKSLSL
jgi:hypothetical protein